uniref:Uncharacterized protein n=1 Tax=Malurus cyaneus samueli TaxID=2593467 RepID=A0A8C5TUS4_9PASS
MAAHRGAMLSAEAGQERLAQAMARLQRYRQESSTQLLATRDELARLHTRLEAARQDALQWVREGGCPGAPQGEGRQFRPQMCCTREMPGVMEGAQLG